MYPLGPTFSFTANSVEWNVYPTNFVVDVQCFDGVCLIPVCTHSPHFFTTRHLTSNPELPELSKGQFNRQFKELQILLDLNLSTRCPHRFNYPVWTFNLILPVASNWDPRPVPMSSSIRPDFSLQPPASKTRSRDIFMY